MQVVIKDIRPSGKAEWVKVSIMGDAHIGAAGCDENKLREHVEYIRQHKMYWVDMGDIAEFITPNDKRWENRNLANWVRIEDLNQLPKVQLYRWYEIVKPIKRWCLGLVEGNHEYSISNYSKSFDLHDEKCRLMGAPNLGFLGVLRLQFKLFNMVRNFDIVCCHGRAASRTPGGKLNNVVKLADIIDADVYVCGHAHDKITYTRPVLSINKQGKLVDKKKGFVQAPSFFRTYVTGKTTYGERALYNPVSTGVTTLAIKPFIQNTKKDERGVRCGHWQPINFHIDS